MYICKIMRITQKIFISLLAAASLLSCAKISKESDNIASKRALEAWVQVHYPDAVKTDKGIYILEDLQGEGQTIKDSNFVYYNFVTRKLYDSTITGYNQAEYAIQMNSYDSNAYYGPSLTQFIKGSASTTLQEILLGSEKMPAMKEGGKRTVILPGWISESSQVYATEADYLARVSGGTHTIYTVEFIKQKKDIYQEQIDSIETYMITKGMEICDTTGHKGLYFWRNKVREAQRGVTVKENYRFPKDTTIYIQYIGRRLDGKVFDTNIKDTAIKYGLGTRASTYSPSAVTWSADSTAIKMGGSSVISGFARTLWVMHPFESATGIFTSNYGYGASASGARIPAYSPLIFEIDIVSKP